MECARNNPDYYDLNARAKSARDILKADVKLLNDGLLEQASSLQEECRRRRHHVKKVRYELGLRIQELEEKSDFTHRRLYSLIGHLDEAELDALCGTAEFNETRRQKIALAREELHTEIIEEQEARAARELELYAQIEDSRALIHEEQEVRATETEAAAKSREELKARIGENTASIEREASLRAAEKAEASAEMTTVQVYIGDLTSAELEAALSEADGQARGRLKLARAREELTAQIEEGKKASAEYRLELLALMEGNDAKYEREISAVSTQIASEAKSLETLEAAVKNNTAAITTEQKVRADADSAYASSISTLKATVSGHTSSIETLNEVKNGVTARSYLKLDANGYISGTESYNGGAGNSSFIVTADKFKVVPPNTKSPQDIFEYDSRTQKLTLKNIEADGAIIKSGTIGGVQLSSGAITAEKLNAGAVTADKIASSAIEAKHLKAGAITAEKLNVGAITADKIQAKAITIEKINDGAVTDAKLAESAVTRSKIEDDAISSLISYGGSGVIRLTVNTQWVRLGYAAVSAVKGRPVLLHAKMTTDSSLWGSQYTFRTYILKSSTLAYADPTNMSSANDSVLVANEARTAPIEGQMHYTLVDISNKDAVMYYAFWCLVMDNKYSDSYEAQITGFDMNIISLFK